MTSHFEKERLVKTFTTTRNDETKYFFLMLITAYCAEENEERHGSIERFLRELEATNAASADDRPDHVERGFRLLDGMSDQEARDTLTHLLWFAASN